MAFADSLIHAWKMNEASDGSAPVTRNDAVGDWHLTDYNTTASAAGKLDAAANVVKANNEYLQRAACAVDLSAGFWISAWVNPASRESADYSARYAVEMGLAYDYSKIPIQLYMGTEGANIYWDMFTSDGATYRQAYTIGQQTWASVQNKWTFLIGTYNPSVGVDLWFGTDGGALTRALYPGAPLPGDPYSLVAQPFSIGHTVLGGIPSWDGLVDNVQLGNVPATADDAAWLYNGGLGRELPEAAAGNRRRRLLCGG